MIKSVYHSGYHDEFGRTHVVLQKQNGYFSFSYIIYSQLKKMGKIKDHKQYIKDHPYIGKSFIGKDGKKFTVKRVSFSECFGKEYAIVYEDEKGSGSTFSSRYYGNYIWLEKRPFEDYSLEYFNRKQCNLEVRENI